MGAAKKKPPLATRPRLPVAAATSEMSAAEVQARARVKLAVTLTDEQIARLRELTDRTQGDLRTAATALAAMRDLAQVEGWKEHVAPWLAQHEERLEGQASMRRTAGRALGQRALIIEEVDRWPGHGGFLGTGRTTTPSELALLSLVLWPRRGAWADLMANETAAMKDARKNHGLPRSRRAHRLFLAQLREEWPPIPVVDLRAIQSEIEREIVAARGRPDDERIELLRRRKDVRHLLDAVPEGADALPALPDRAPGVLVHSWIYERLRGR